MLNSKILVVVLALLAAVSGCKKDESLNNRWLNDIEPLYAHNTAKVNITEGVAGTLTLKEGNCMPAIEPANTSCREYPVKRRIRIYEYTLPKDAEHKKGSVYKKVHTKLIENVDCDKEGFYQAKLSPGKYSVFVEEKGDLYANSSDAEGGLNPVIVEAGKVTGLNLRLNYAVY